MGTVLQPPVPPLAACGILLRPLEEGDLDWLVEACSDSELGRYMPVLPSPYTIEDARRFLAYSAEGWASGSHAPFVITDETSGTQLGVVELHLQGDGVASVGYWLAPAHRGRGAATTAVRRVADWALSTLALTRLEITADPRNLASQRVAERAGFVREGIRRGYLPVGDERIDRVMFALSPDRLRTPGRG